MNLGAWEAELFWLYVFKKGAKLSAKVKVPPPLQIQFKLYVELVSICIKYKFV